MPVLMNGLFIHLTWANALVLVLLGLVGGVISGFAGSGAAFIMTPGMMNLHVPGVVAVGSNMAHRFGNNMMGARRHAGLGNVDKRLSILLLATALVGVQVAVWINSRLFKMASGEGQEGSGGAMSNLYISLIFIGVLSFVGSFMLRDALRPRDSKEGGGPSMKLANMISNITLPPMVYFPVADVRVSLWLVLLLGLVVGFLDGTVAIGGFLGVPAMIYLFGVPTTVATGSELFMAMFGGAWGAVSYAYQGFVDLRLSCLLLLGSLMGVYIGAYGTKVVKEVLVRLVASSIILLCVLSRAVAVPVYLHQLHYLQFSEEWEPWFKGASTAILFAAGIGGTGLVLFHVVKATLERRKVHSTLLIRKAEGDGRVS